MEERNEGEERREEGPQAPAAPGDLLGTPPPGTFPGGQQAGRLTGAEPADPEEADAATARPDPEEDPGR